MVVDCHKILKFKLVTMLTNQLHLFLQCPLDRIETELLPLAVVNTCSLTIVKMQTDIIEPKFLPLKATSLQTMEQDRKTPRTLETFRIYISKGNKEPLVFNKLSKT